MFIYKVWRDGFDGGDVTDSHWFDEQKAQCRCQEKQEIDTDAINGFAWQVITIETEDEPYLS